MNRPNEEELSRVYGETVKSRLRYEHLTNEFEKHFGKRELEFFTAPGRTEIIGNHTDHNGGKILAASIDRDTIGAAYPNDKNEIEIISEGYKDQIIVDLDLLEQIPINQGTISLVAGLAMGVRKLGYQIEGFQAYLSTEVISSAGVSSSASFEMLLCTMINYFFNDGKMTCIDYARIGQYAENHYWSKASGLMDQMACAVGGTILLDFKEDVQYEKIDFSFEKIGYDLIIVNTGKGHADLSQEYSLVPSEMKQVAEAMGYEKLADANLNLFLKQLPSIVEKTKNDRGLLRALHFFQENERVEQIVGHIREHKIKDIMRVIEASGRSSWELLQNCYSLSDYKEQKITLYLALTKHFLAHVKDGCCRVHGGGFAGVIMSVIPHKYTEEYVRFIAQYAGAENVYPMHIRAVGAVHLDK